VRQRQQAVRVCAVRLWPFAPSSAASVLICVAVATSIALSPERLGAVGHLLMMVMLGLCCWCGGIVTHGHHQLLVAAKGDRSA
jgi:hypothetical protein